MRDFGEYCVIFAALPVYTVGFIAGALFIPLRGGWREAMQILGDATDKERNTPKQ